MSNAAALAGVAQNAHFRTSERLAAAKQALDFYVDQEDQLRELLTYCKMMRDGNESGDAREAYDDAATRLRKILDGE